MSDTALEYLAGSDVRPESLATLRDQGPLSLRDLSDRVPASRRTVKRTLTEMESRGWVKPRDGAYELTALGATMLSAHEDFRERSQVATRLRPFLEHAPAPTFDLDVCALDDATMISPDDDPTAVIDSLVDLRAGAERVREYTPYLLLDSVRQLAEQVGGRSAPDVALVLSTETPSQPSPEYCDRFETLLASPNADVRLHHDGPEIGFGVVDDHAFFGVTDAQRMPQALLVSDDDAVVSWVERRFADYRDAAEPLSPE
jgi:predicted transcriptional regulator